MGYVLPWSILMAYQVYTKGIQKGKLPEPFYFTLPTAAIGICAVIGMKDSRLGIALAWAVLIAVAVANQVNRDPSAQSQTQASGATA
jgi:hypothetical protein